MGTRVRFAIWRKDGKLFRVKPPDWPRNCEYSCNSQEDLIAWAQGNGYILKDGNPPKRENRRFA